ncbi:MAG: hypothetical protein K2M64_00455, partial [Clostridia bacterium]|nr:hypothetical protein [Clostridia bacterium]
MANFLYKNIVWNFNKNVDSNLLTMPTTAKQFEEQLYGLSKRTYPDTKQVEYINAEFYLNQVALLKAKSPAVEVAKSYFDKFWTGYLKLKNIFSSPYATFPAYKGKTRIEHIAELITKCSQFAEGDQTVSQMTESACKIVNLSDKEARYLPYIVELYKTIFYCKAVIAVNNGKQSAVASLAKLLRPTLLAYNYEANTLYTQAPYTNDRLLSVVDCMGNSLTQFDGITTDVNTKMYVYANGRNVFDTFVESKLGCDTAEFRSQSNSFACNTQYFVTGNCEIRKVSIKNLAKTKRKYVVEVVTKHSGNDTAYFNLGSALCLSAANDRLYVASAVVCNNGILPYTGDNTQNYEFSLAPCQQLQFDIVTIYAHDTPTIAKELDNLQYYGATACPYVCDEPCKNLRKTEIKLALTPSGYNIKKPKTVLSTRLNYTYQLGDADTATFADNGGNTATLIKGFVFGVRGEKVYSVRGALIDEVCSGQFNVDCDSLRYDKAKSTCIIRHNDGKQYEISYKTPCKTLFVFPFEKQSKVTLKGNVFTIVDDERNYTITCETPFESYTTNALECNEDRLRYKLSNNLQAGSCLCVCLQTASVAKLRIKSGEITPAPSPIVRECLVSTYLNYINEKNTFCLNNFIKKPDGFTIASICYTNPQFVKNYLTKRFRTQQKGYYYDVQGRKTAFEDKLAFPLAFAYYKNLVADDLPKNYLNAINGVIFYEEFTGKDLCVKALILKKLAQLDTDDKVRYLVEYNSLK